MKVAIVGSRGLEIDDFSEYLPRETTEIVSGGAAGIDQSARRYALKHGSALKEFLPEYHRYGKGAPLKRNLQIIDYADLVLAFWDGSSRGTKYTVEQCRKLGVPVQIVIKKHAGLG